MKNDGTGLLWAAGLIFGAIGVTILAALAEVEAAVWVGSLFLLFFGVPLVTIGTVCLVVGLVRRRRSKRQASGETPSPLTPAKSAAHRGFGLLLLILGGVLLLKSVGTAMYLAVKLHEAGLQVMLPLMAAKAADPVLWIGVGLVFWGRSLFRNTQQGILA